MYIKNNDCEEFIMEESVIVMNNIDHTLHVLNETASLIWMHIEDSTISEIIDIIVGKYVDVSVDIVAQDVSKTINFLLEKGLITVK